MEVERRNKRGSGDILGVSGSNFFDFFDQSSSTFTTADYPLVTCEDTPYLDETFDYIMCNQVLEHVSKPWLCVDECYRILKKGGHVIIVVPSIYQEHRWPKDNWRILKDGMEVLLSEFSNFTVGTFGNSELLIHMIENAKDRYSFKMMKIVLNGEKKKDTATENIFIQASMGLGENRFIRSSNNN